MDGTVEDVVELSTLTRFSRFSALLTEGQEGLKGLMNHSKNQGAKTCRKLFGLHVTYIIN